MDIRRIAWLLLVGLLLVATQPQSACAATFTDETDFWLSEPNPQTYITNGFSLPPGEPNPPAGIYLSRQTLANNLPFLRGVIFQKPVSPYDELGGDVIGMDWGEANALGQSARQCIDENFIWYAPDEVVPWDVLPRFEGRALYTFQSHGREGLDIRWARIYVEFPSGATFHVFHWGDTFMSRVCANYYSGIGAQPTPPPTISGCKWNDRNGNGVRDADEEGLPGWTIILRGNGQERAATTGPDGRYQFVMDARQGLTPGVYTLDEVPQPGWTQTHAPGPVQVEEGSAGRDYSGNDFGNMEPTGSISGAKWQDMNGDGAWQSGEPPLQTWTIALYQNGNRIAQAQTAADGSYTFDRLRAGTYVVREDLPAGWLQTYPAGGSYTIVLAPGQAVGGVHFGNFQWINLQGVKWNDTNQDGAGKGVEPRIAGWRVVLYRGASQVGQQYTDDHGAYCFPGLGPGDYTVWEDKRAEWCQTHWGGVSSPAPDPALEAGHYWVSARSGQSAVDCDFGNFHLGKISGAKYDDTNMNGVHDAGEPPLANWPIVLIGPGGVRTPTTTDANGFYQFTGLVYGAYTVWEKSQNEWIQTAPPADTTTPPEGLEPGHHSVDISSGSNIAGEDFLNFHLGKIAGTKWDDSNVSGTKDDGESKLAGWKVVLFGPGGSRQETTTGADGAYQFIGLRYGSYAVFEEARDHWRQAWPLPQDGGTPPEADLAAGSYQVGIQSGSDVKCQDFGNVQLGSITKTVHHYWWHTPLAGVQVTLEEVNVPGILHNDLPLPATNPSGSDGSILFDYLLPGDYQIDVTIPDGWFEEPPYAPHGVTLQEGKTPVVHDTLYGCGRREPRTIGFWKSWRKRYTPEQMSALIERVQAGSAAFAGLSLSTIDAALDTSGKKPISRMADIQYLALWLNLASERLGFTPLVDISTISGWSTVVSDTYGADDGTMTVHELMKQLVAAYNGGSLTPAQWEVFKNICDAVNNYRVFPDPPTGSID